MVLSPLGSESPFERHSQQRPGHAAQAADHGDERRHDPQLDPAHAPVQGEQAGAQMPPNVASTHLSRGWGRHEAVLHHAPRRSRPLFDGSAVARDAFSSLFRSRAPFAATPRSCRPGRRSRRRAATIHSSIRRAGAGRAGWRSNACNVANTHPRGCASPAPRLAPSPLPRSCRRPIARPDRRDRRPRLARRDDARGPARRDHDDGPALRARPAPRPPSPPRSPRGRHFANRSRVRQGCPAARTRAAARKRPKGGPDQKGRRIVMLYAVLVARQSHRARASRSLGILSPSRPSSRAISRSRHRSASMTYWRRSSAQPSNGIGYALLLRFGEQNM